MKETMILVVDDEPIARFGTVAILESLGYQSQDCPSAKAALALLQTGDTAFDAILMDCNMPEMDGFACTAAIREWEKASGKHIPILGWTSEQRENIKESCLEAGMDDCLHKTSSPESLQTVLKSLIKAD